MSSSIADSDSDYQSAMSEISSVNDLKVFEDSKTYFMTPLLDENMEIDGKNYVLFRKNNGQIDILVVNIPAGTDAFVSKVTIDDKEIIENKEINMDIEMSSNPNKEKGTVIAVLKTEAKEVVDLASGLNTSTSPGTNENEIENGRGGGAKKQKHGKQSSVKGSRKVQKKK